MSEIDSKARDLFLQALDLQPDQIAGFLNDACGDSELRRRVQKLLDAHNEAGGFLAPSHMEETNIGPHNDRGSDDFPETMIRATLGPGTIIGPYKLLEQIGEGGMGSVWVASQSEPIKRRVAIKLIKAGMDTGQVLARFEAERQALAMMDHPNIARVLDGGMTDQGRPYFAMEYVKGVPLTEYCDNAKLSLKERLELFLPVCHAVQHAHQKGIIHRDLKPSNILVCLYDGKPVPKVIDFGLAKAMHESLTDRSIYTSHGMMVGTPLYMSPEQAEQNNLDIDTRTDVYALGVILYELLTGTTPLEKAQMKEAAYGEVLRLIKEVEPPKPSTRLSGSESLPSVAAQRGIEPAQLTRSITGDLDWVVMKALDKERTRRYETANGLAEDIQRHLSDEPVSASPPSVSYRMKKFIRRNRAGVIAASVIATTLLLGVAGATGGMLWALSEKELAVKARSAQEGAQRLAEAEMTRARIAEQKTVETLKAVQAERDAKEVALKEAEAATQKEQRARELLADEKRHAVANLYGTSIRLAQQHWATAKIDQMDQVLNETPVELRNWEWSYLRNLAHGAKVNLRGSFIGFHSDSEHLVLGDVDSTVCTWNVQSQDETNRRVVKGTNSDICRSCSHVASLVGDNIEVMSLTTGEVLLKQPLPEKTKKLERLVLSDDGATLALIAQTKLRFGWKRNVRIIDVATGETKSVIPEIKDKYCAAISPDGKLFAGRKDLGEVVTIWNAETAEEVATLTGHVNPVRCVSFDSESKLIATGGYLSAKIWDARTGIQVHNLHGHAGRVRFSQDGRWLVTAGTVMARIWHVQSGVELVTIRGNTAPVMAAALSPDNKWLATGSQDRMVRVWDVSRYTGFEEQALGEEFAKSLLDRGLSEEQKSLLEAGLRREAFQHCSQDYQTRYLRRTPVRDVEFFFNSDLFVTTGTDKRIVLWSTEQVEPIRSWDAPFFITDVTTSPDGKTFAVATGRGMVIKDDDRASVYVWQTDADEPVHRLKNPWLFAGPIAISPDGKYLAASGSTSDTKRGLVIYDLATGDELKTIRTSGDLKRATGLAFSNDSKSIFASYDLGLTGRWSIDPNVEEATWTMETGSAHLAVHPTKDVIATTHEDGHIRIWNANTRDQIDELKGPPAKLWMRLAFSPDGRRIVSCSNETGVTLWDAENHLKLLELDDHSKRIISRVAFSSDGRFIASAGQDGTCKLWDAGRVPIADDEAE